jgi:hypothetical protein
MKWELIIGENRGWDRKPSCKKREKEREACRNERERTWIQSGPWGKGEESWWKGLIIMNPHGSRCSVDMRDQVSIPTLLQSYIGAPIIHGHFCGTLSNCTASSHCLWDLLNKHSLSAEPWQIKYLWSNGSEEVLGWRGGEEWDAQT